MGEQEGKEVRETKEVEEVKEVKEDKSAIQENGVPGKPKSTGVTVPRERETQDPGEKSNLGHPAVSYRRRGLAGMVVGGGGER